MNTLVNWVLVFHLSGMVMWIGGLLMALTAAKPGPPEPAARSERGRLAQQAMRRLAHPGAALMVVTGGLLMYLLPGVRDAAWLQTKLTLVLILIGLDLSLTFRLRKMPEQEPSAGQIGMYHGMIGLLLVFILILVLVKPF